MDDFKSILDSKDLRAITEKIDGFFAPAEGYENRLKLSIATATVISKSLSLLNTIDSDSFISELRDKLDKIERDAKASRTIHMDHLRLDQEVRSSLCEDENATLEALEGDIRDALSRMDNSLKDLILLRDKLPISKIVEGK